MKSRVAVVRVSPETVLEDIDRLCELAGVEAALPAGRTTILKDNISWHFPFPGANTTPWQLEGTTRALRARGLDDLVCVQNKTVVTDAFKGEDLNGYVPIFKAYDIPVRYNFKPEDMSWSVYRPAARMNVLDDIFPEGILIPDDFHGTNIVHLPTVKCVAGTTEVMLADGTLTTIAQVVERELERGGGVVEADGTIHAEGRVELLAMAPDGSVGPHVATHFARTPRGDRPVLRVRLRSGRALTATSDHRVFTQDEWLPVGRLRLGTRVAVARRIGPSLEPASRVVVRAGARLRVLRTEDLAWDEVEAVEAVDEEVVLYDVTVPGAESFIASGVVAHNCHIYTTTTGAMKNAFGGLLNTKRHYTHSWIHATLVDLLAIQKEIHSGLFAVMDGTTAGDGPGPRTMRPVIKDVMLASADQVAIDAVAAQMMGFDPMSIEYIRLADEQGLGAGRRVDIEVVGDAHLADERWGFSVGDNGASRVGDVMWFGPLKRFQKLFFHTPLVNLFVMGSEVYHDYYRWPLRDRQVFEAWCAETTWGQLFQRYQAEGAQGADDAADIEVG